MPLFKIKTRHLKDYSISTEKFSNTAVAAFAKTLTPKVRLANTANVSYIVSAATAVNLGGGYIVLTGSDFQSGAQVLVGNTTATSTSFVNSTTLRAEVPAKPAGTYNLFIVNPDGGTAIRVNGITYGTAPSFSTATTLPGQQLSVNFGFNISATSDSTVSYSNTSALPAGTTLLSNGWFYGVDSGVTETTYSFTVKATDIELQDTSKTFNLSTFIPKGLWTWGSNFNGQLGSNSTVARSSPVQVGTDTNWNNISLPSSISHTLATKYDGTLWAWGVNGEGGLGLNDRVGRSSPTQVGTGTTWSLVAAGSGPSAAIKYDGTLWTWGQNDYGELGQNDRGINRSSPVQVGTDTTWSKIENGLTTFIAIKTDGTLWSWGLNLHGQLGENDTVDRSSPVQVGSGTNWSSVTLGFYNVLAIKTDGTLWAWGQNDGGQFGLNDRINRSSPTQIGALTTWSSAKTAINHTVAIKTDGTLWTWGDNSSGALGTNSTIRRSSPVQVGTDTYWRSVLNASFDACHVTKTDGTLWAWGENSTGKLGFGNKTNRSSPVQLGTDTGWIKMDGYSVAAGIKIPNPVWTSSTLSTVSKYQSFSGQLPVTGANTVSLAEGSSLPAGMTISANGYYYGNNTTITSDTTYTFTVIANTLYGTSANSTLSLTVTVTKLLYLWGSNFYGILGLNDTVYRSSPVQLGSGSGSWSKISLDSQSTAAIKTDGTLWGWGYGGDGSLGNNNAISRSSPVQIGTGTTWSETTRNRFSTFGIKTDGTLWAWGSGDSGQHGTNNISSKSSPTQVGALTNWSKVIGGSQLSHAIKTDGTLWALGGEANSGLFGNSTSSALNLFRSSPVQIGALTNWTTKMSSDGTVGAIKTDGTLWTWGYNAYGQNADGTQIPRSSPVQVGTGTDWAEIATTQEIVVAIKTGGTLWAWGRNESGQLGFNDTVNRSSPVQLGSDTNWNKVSSRNSFVAATKTDGTLWIWGNNTNGQLGFNDRVNRSSPVQVGIGTTWNDISILNNFASTSPIAVLEVQ
jgi:alpha-tubulin suppressor-like RCC1 family protein